MVIWCWTYGIGPDSERGHPLLQCGLLFLISNKDYSICMIPQTGYHIPWPLVHQSQSTSWHEKQLNGSPPTPMTDGCDDPLHYEWALQNRATSRSSKPNMDNNIHASRQPIPKHYIQDTTYLFYLFFPTLFLIPYIQQCGNESHRHNTLYTVTPSVLQYTSEFSFAATTLINIVLFFKKGIQVLRLPY